MICRLHGTDAEPRRAGQDGPRRGPRGRRLFLGFIAAVLMLTVSAGAFVSSAKADVAGGAEEGVYLIKSIDPEDKTASYIRTDTFPEDFGADPAYCWNTTTPYTRSADKVLFLGRVGLTPRDLGSFVIDELGVTVGFCVPELPKAIYDYAFENGFNAVKMYVKKNPSDRYFFLDGEVDKIYFYQHWLKIDSRIYPLMDDVKNKYSVSLNDGFKLPAEYLNVTEETVLLFTNYVLTYAVKVGTPGGYFDLDQERCGVTIYGGDLGSSLMPDESIEYTDGALSMSEKEARWFVDFLRSALPD